MQNINACIKFSPTACQFTPLPHQCHHSQCSPSFVLLSTLTLYLPPIRNIHRHLYILTRSSITIPHRNYGHPVPRIRESRRRFQETPSKAHRRRATPGTYPNSKSILPQLYTILYRLSSAKLTYPALRIVQDRNRRGFRRSYQARLIRFQGPYYIPTQLSVIILLLKRSTLLSDILDTG